MSDKSAIEWTDATWNPVTGCSKVSPGCAYCYAETLSLRFGWSRLPWTPDNAAENVVLHPERLDQPLKWRTPRMVFVNSMADLFHPLVPPEFIARVWMRMEAASDHTFQILTKRPERMQVVVDDLPYLPNVWLGTSIENDHWISRADTLRATRAAVRFISAEPLLGPLSSLNLAGIDWLIVGGESGGPPRRALVRKGVHTRGTRGNGQVPLAVEPRPEALQWVRELRDRAGTSGTAFFLKQWGGRTPKAGGRELDGRTWDEMPLLRLAATSSEPEFRHVGWSLDAIPRDDVRKIGGEREPRSRNGTTIEA